MFNWLKRRVQLSSLRAATEDLDRIIAHLKGMAASEVAMVVALATCIRITLRSVDGIDLQYVLSGDAVPKSDAELKAVIQIPRLIRKFQKEGLFAEAAALMLWHQSLRIITLYPELRTQGRIMWREVYRGFDGVEAALDELQQISGRQIPKEAYETYRFVPYGLEPTNS